MFENLQSGAARRRPARQTTLRYGPWPGGLITERQAEQAKRIELPEVLNFVITGDGMVRTRDGATLVSEGATGELKYAGDVKVGSSWYTFYTDDDDTLYYDASGTATAIATLEGETRFVGYRGSLILFDGSYIKKVSNMTSSAWSDNKGYVVDELVVHGTAPVGYRCIDAHTSVLADDEPGVGTTWTTKWEATWADVLYDNGGGATAPYQFTNRTGDDDSSLALGNGTNVRIATKFTSAAWDAGYTMPPTTVFATLSRALNGFTGVDNVNITASLRLASDSSVLATKTLVTAPLATNLTTSGIEHEVTFAAADITTEMSPGVAYYMSIEYNNGDATNYVHVHVTTVASGGSAFKYIAAWSAEATSDPLMGLKPGLPPKAISGIVNAQKLYAMEGEDGTNPSYLHYCAANNEYDWSTDDGGGYVAAIDDSATGFPIGAIGIWYEDVWVFGTARQPFLARLTGASPVSYALNSTLQQISTHYKGLTMTPDDMWFVHGGGIDSVGTIQEFGDLRYQSVAENIRSTVQLYFSTAAFTGYEPGRGLYCLKLASHNYVYVVHTKLKNVNRQGSAKALPESPVSRWQFAFTDVPTCFGNGDGVMYVGTDTGKLYKIDSTVVEDDDNAVEYKLLTNVQSTRFKELSVNKISPSVFGRFGGAFDLTYYKNHNRTSFHSTSVNTPWDTTADPTEFTMPVDEMLFLIEPEEYFDREGENFNFRALQIGVENVVLNGRPLYFGGLEILADAVGGF